MKFQFCLSLNIFPLNYLNLTFFLKIVSNDATALPCLILGPNKMETSLPTGSSEVVDKPMIIMVEAKMVGTQTDLVLAEKKSSLEKETQDVKVAKYFF